MSRAETKYIFLILSQFHYFLPLEVSHGLPSIAHFSSTSQQNPLPFPVPYSKGCLWAPVHCVSRVRSPKPLGSLTAPFSSPPERGLRKRKPWNKGRVGDTEGAYSRVPHTCSPHPYLPPCLPSCQELAHTCSRCPAMEQTGKLIHKPVIGSISGCSPYKRKETNTNHACALWICLLCPNLPLLSLQAAQTIPTPHHNPTTHLAACVPCF